MLTGILAHPERCIHLFQQQHLVHLRESCSLHPVEIDAACDSSVQAILPIPPDAVVSRNLIIVDQRENLLAKDILYVQCDLSGLRYGIQNRRCRVERVRVVLTESESSWNGCCVLIYS